VHKNTLNTPLLCLEFSDVTDPSDSLSSGRSSQPSANLMQVINPQTLHYHLQSMGDQYCLSDEVVQWAQTLLDELLLMFILINLNSWIPPVGQTAAPTPTESTYTFTQIF
ncbi:hypothetical protein MJO28_005276, partial [Puccinia striiformis f. sp. tritici]